MAQKTENVFLTDQIEDLPFKNNYKLGDSTSIMYCRKGTLQVEFENKTVTLSAHDVILGMPKTLVKSIKYSDDFQFYMLRLKSQIFDEIFMEYFRLEPRWWEKHTYLSTNPIFRLGKFHQQLIEAYYQFLCINLQGPMSTYRRHVLQALARAVVLEALNFMEELLSAKNPEGEFKREPIGQSDFIFRQFLQLLQENKQEREVQYFAEKIGLTPKYLSEVCKLRSGKTASEWIAEVTRTEIIRLLTTTNFSIKEIAYRMNFPNSSFFSQYVKKHCGMSPIKVRRNH